MSGTGDLRLSKRPPFDASTGSTEAGLSGSATEGDLIRLLFDVPTRDSALEQTQASVLSDFVICVADDLEALAAAAKANEQDLADVDVPRMLERQVTRLRAMYLLAYRLEAGARDERAIGKSKKRRAPATKGGGRAA